MASIDGGGGGRQKGKPQKLNTRVDFTPMVDMMMLLLTFFMFCTTLSKPQIMDLAMPMPDDEIKKDEKPDTKESQAMTIILGADNKVYYYTGKPKEEDYQDYTTLKETTYPSATDGGFRDVLAQRNSKIIDAMRKLKADKADKSKKMSDDDFKERAKEIRADKDGQVVVIKATEGATYANLVDVLDEMAICSVGRYAVVDMADGDNYLLENYLTKGEFGRTGGTTPQ